MALRATFALLMAVVLPPAGLGPSGPAIRLLAMDILKEAILVVTSVRVARPTSWVVLVREA